MLNRILIPLTIVLFVNIYFNWHLKLILKPSWYKIITAIMIFLTVTFFLCFYLYQTSTRVYLKRTIIHFFLTPLIFINIGFFIADLIFIIDDILNLIINSLRFIKNYFSNEISPKKTTMVSSRRLFLNWLGIIFSSGLVLLLIKGLFNKYNFQFKKINIKSQQFIFKQPLKIIQISDIHSGSFNANKNLSKLIDEINQLEPDIVFFTGDLVNNAAKEMTPELTAIFKEIKATGGVYSILGNHDYGDYVNWDTPQDKEQNFQDLIQRHKELNWELLRNEHRILNSPKSEIPIHIIGVENWSHSKNFGKRGDINKALEGLNQDGLKILLSHDPTHWEYQIKEHYPDILLTLSGHTHGMQFGIENSWIKWSPVKYFYTYWAGLYQDKNQFLYVNRGLGCIGYQGRVGILPEITLIELSS